jgi:dCTP deaminase
MVGDVANHIAAEVGGTQYPAGLGHIQIPYSQADGLFLNTILAHEMGHFIYQEYASHDVEVAIDTALGAMEKESLVITPLLQRKKMFEASSDSDSIDLRLGTHFLLPQVPPVPFTYPCKGSAKQSHVRVHVPLGSYLVVPAHETVLGSTLEFIKMPGDLSGEILTKSSVARTFTVIETAPWIHPGYRGCLTLEIANASNTPLILYPGRLIAQLILLKLLDTEARDKKLSGTYLAPIYPEAPTFEDPVDDLNRIGVPKSQFRSPYQDQRMPLDRTRRLPR